MYYVFLTLLVNILRYIKIPKKAGERSPASTHIRLYVCLSYIAHVYTQKPGVGKTNKRHFSWIKSPDIFRPCCVLCSIAGAFCSFSLMSHLVTSSGISSLFSLSYLTPFFCILFVCVRPQCFAPLLLFLLSHFLYTRHFIIHHVAPPLFFTPALFILFSLFSLCFFSRVLFLHLTVHHRAAYFLLFNTAGAALYPLIIFFFFLSLIIPHTYSFISSLPLFLRSLFHFCVIHHTPARLLHHSLFFLINTRRPIIGINTHSPIIGRHFLFSLFCQSLHRHSLSYHCFYLLLFFSYLSLLSIILIHQCLICHYSLLTTRVYTVQRCHYVTGWLRMQPSAFFLPPARLPSVVEMGVGKEWGYGAKIKI